MLKIKKSSKSFLQTLSKVFVICFLPIGIAGCVSDNNADLLASQQKVEPADLVYNEALANFDAKRYKEAALKFGAVQTQHPLTSWAKKALVMEVFSNFRGGQYSAAAEAASRYLSQYPKTDDAAYVNYLMGISYFKQIPSSSYDQANAEATIKAMQSLIKDYPDSEYVKDAKIKMRFAKAQLAQKSMDIARYYQKQKNYVAALKRYRYVLETYGDTNLAPEALYRCVELYQTLGLTVEAKTAGYILGYNYPNSTWYKQAYALLQNLNEPQETDKSSWLYNLFKN